MDTLPAAWLTDAHLREGADAALECCPLSYVWGFVDGTARPIRRPTEGRRLFYSGHKRIHALKFQSVVTPFGIIVHLFGPVDGRRQDSHILQESGLQLQTEQHLKRGDWKYYGHPAYPIRPQLLRPFQGSHSNT